MVSKDVTGVARFGVELHYRLMRILVLLSALVCSSFLVASAQPPLTYIGTVIDDEPAVGYPRPHAHPDGGVVFIPEGRASDTVALLGSELDTLVAVVLPGDVERWWLRHVYSASATGSDTDMILLEARVAAQAGSNTTAFIGLGFDGSIAFDSRDYLDDVDETMVIEPPLFERPAFAFSGQVAWGEPWVMRIFDLASGELVSTFEGPKYASRVGGNARKPLVLTKTDDYVIGLDRRLSVVDTVFAVDIAGANVTLGPPDATDWLGDGLYDFSFNDASATPVRNIIYDETGRLHAAIDIPDDAIFVGETAHTGELRLDGEDDPYIEIFYSKRSGGTDRSVFNLRTGERMAGLPPALDDGVCFRGERVYYDDARPDSAFRLPNLELAFVLPDSILDADGASYTPNGPFGGVGASGDCPAGSPFGATYVYRNSISGTRRDLLVVDSDFRPIAKLAPGRRSMRRYPIAELNAIYFISYTPGRDSLDYYVLRESSSVREVAEATLRVYPNPAGDYVHVGADAPLVRVEVYDAAGRLRRSVRDGSDLSRVDLAGLPGGVYVLRAVAYEGEATTSLILISR